MVYSSSRLCSSFSVVFAFILPYVVCYPNGALLSAPRSLPSLPAFSFLFLFIIFFTLHDTHFFCFLFFSFLLSSNLSNLGTTLNFLILYINFSNTYVLYCWFFSILCSFTGFMPCFYFFLLVFFARSLRLFFSFSLLVMLLALTWFNFFHVFSPLHALSNLFLPATCSPSWFL